MADNRTISQLEAEVILGSVPYASGLAASIAVHFNCADDYQAIILAKKFADGHDVELWQLDRKVATFPKVLKKG